jgi:hypothetical protein
MHAGDAPSIDKPWRLGCTFPEVCHTWAVSWSQVTTPIDMSVSYFQERGTPASQDVLSPATPSIGTASRGANALSSRITSVLSASYADLEIRDALETLDSRGVQNTAETRRQIRLDVQKEVIECNGEIVKDFGQVAEVC